MDPVLPSVPTLYNYDTNRDDDPGLLIQKGGTSADEAQDARHQHWQTSPFAAAVTVQGDALVKLWSAPKDLDDTKGGAVTVYLRDCSNWGTGWTCVGLGSDTVTDADWLGGSPSWALKTFTVPLGTHTLHPGHTLDLVVVVNSSSDDDMWFAYDTGPYRSRVSVSASSEVWPPLAAVELRTLASQLSQICSRWLFA